jgi:hypothetical protein
LQYVSRNSNAAMRVFTHHSNHIFIPVCETRSVVTAVMQNKNKINYK